MWDKGSHTPLAPFGGSLYRPLSIFALYFALYLHNTLLEQNKKSQFHLLKKFARSQFASVVLLHFSSICISYKLLKRTQSLLNLTEKWIKTTLYWRGFAFCLRLDFLFSYKLLNKKNIKYLESHRKVDQECSLSKSLINHLCFTFMLFSNSIN